MSRHLRRDRGAAAVETSLIIGLLVLIALGSAEWGFGLRDWLSVTAGSREGARVGAAAGDTTGADCVILEGAAGAVRDINGAVLEVWVYESDTAGSVGARQRYRPFVAADNALFLRCGTWFIMENSWPEASRDNDGTTRDWLGVRVVFDHDWITGFAWFSGSVCNRGASGTCWSADTVMHVEPDPNP
jgi:Flp pilus assembly pilin Flp